MKIQGDHGPLVPAANAHAHVCIVSPKEDKHLFVNRKNTLSYVAYNNLARELPRTFLLTSNFNIHFQSFTPKKTYIFDSQPLNESI